MDGQLKDHPLAELIHEISDARLSGALRLARESVRAAVYFGDGQTLAAFMNLRAHRLVEMLRRAGAVDAARLGAVVHEGMNDEQAGAAIVHAGLLSASELWRLQTRQSSETLREMLRWTECDWSFESRVRLAGNYRAQPNTPQLLIECGRNFPHEMISRRLCDESETVAPAGGVSEKIEAGIQLMPNEAFVLSRVGGPMRMSEVVAVSGLPAELTRRAVYALALGGLLERSRWPQALSPELAGQSRARAAAIEGAVHETDLQQEVRAQQTPIEARENQLGVAGELLARAGGANHYEVMGVARTASLDEVKRAYYSHAKRFHPDLFRRDADAGLQQRIDAAFAKIAQAYDVLKDSSLRTAYDLKLAKGKAAAPAPPVAESAAQTGSEEARTRPTNDAPAVERDDAPQHSAAEQKFQQGLAALRQNDLARARELLKEAALLVPQQARYRAHFGRVLARDKASRRQAESEMLAAVALDAENASYHVMLAELYIDVGLRRKAEGEIQRALALEPGNASARRLLEELRMTG